MTMVRPGRPVWIYDPNSCFDGREGVVQTYPAPTTGTVVVKVGGVPLAFAGSVVKPIYQRPATDTNGDLFPRSGGRS